MVPIAGPATAEAAAPMPSTSRGIRRSSGRAGSKRRSLGLTLVYILWAVVLFHPQWLVAAHGAHFILKVPLVFFGALFVLTLGHVRRGIWYLPVLCMLVFAYATLPFSINLGYSLKPTKQLLLYYVLLVGTLAFVRKPRQAIPVLLMVLVYQFMWWGALGAKNGMVGWDEVYNNYDSYGPLMVMGITSAAYTGLAVRSKWMRRIAFATAALCLIGLVSSFARGAVLAGGLVVAFGWMRSPRKGMATLGIVAAVVVVGLSATLFFSNSNRGNDTNPNFLDEMLTVRQNVTSGTGEGTERKIIWSAAWREFLAKPVFGVGQDCFGPFAASYFRPGQVGGQYAENPRQLYDRKVHNTYLQTLAERGILGMALFLWLIVDFWRRNLRLRRPAAVARWAAGCDGKYDLRALSIAVEAAMVGYLATSLFYNQLLQVNWLWSLLALNMLLYSLSVGDSRRRSRRRARVTPAATV